MILIICEPEDTCGLWLVTELAKRGLAVEHILPEELIIGSRLSARVSNHQDRVEIYLADGRHFKGASLTGVINRMGHFPKPQLRGATDKDLVYIAEEIRAAIVAWLNGLPCPVLNRPAPYSAFGKVMHDSLWRQCASLSGLPSAILRVGDSSTEVNDGPQPCSLVVVGHQVLTAQEISVPPSVVTDAITFAKFMGVRLLGLEFAVNGSGEWAFLRGNLKPDLLKIGEAAIDVLLTELQN